MRATPAVLILLLALATTYAGEMSALQRIADGESQVGRTRSGFRIIAHGADVRMKAPRGWRVALCTEEPLNAQVVCEAPDKKSFVEVRVRAAGQREELDARPTDYLQELRRFKDPQIAMAADGALPLADGRRVSVWRFSSSYWGQRLYTRITRGRAVVDIEASDTRVDGDVARLRQILADVIRSPKA